MSWLAKDLPALVLLLLPGFAAAGVYYSLSAHPKSSEFERVIQALIFTMILKPLTSLGHWFFLKVGGLYSFGPWTQDSETATSLGLAVLLGLGFAWAMSKDQFHGIARKLGLTSRTSYPSQWYSAFVRKHKWVVLHFADGRRIYGWPMEWPDESDKGHFVLSEPEWLLEDNQRAPLHQVAKILIPASDVKMVEFMKEENEIDTPKEELKRVEDLLSKPPEGETHGSESPTTDAQPTSR
jgi:hypothetical protein